MGCGKNGSFSVVPDVRQWAILVSTDKKDLRDLINNPNTVYGKFINGWWRLFKTEQWTLVLDPIEGHGKWDGKEAFGSLPRNTSYEGTIAVLTRATIRLSRLKNFWQNVDKAAAPLQGSEGFIQSIGIGEVPWKKQATFSMWQSKQAMKNYAYRAHQHNDVIHKTRKENWYSEEMFVRFRVLSSHGTLPAHATILPHLKQVGTTEQ